MPIATPVLGTVIDPITFGKAVTDQLNALPVTRANYTNITIDTEGYGTLNFGFTFPTIPIVTWVIDVDSSVPQTAQAAGLRTTTGLRLRFFSGTSLAVSTNRNVMWQAATV